MCQLSFSVLAMRRTGSAHMQPGRTISRTEETKVDLEMAALWLFRPSPFQHAIWFVLKSAGSRVIKVGLVPEHTKENTGMIPLLFFILQFSPSATTEHSSFC